MKFKKYIITALVCALLGTFAMADETESADISESEEKSLEISEVTENTEDIEATEEKASS
ncbi:MAG: hypothetical protein IJZ20_02075 [Clostridia bacterium]|nr:hypothetical protein [Clostridia bacterium]